MDGLKKEIFRYLGYGEKVPDKKILSIIDDCLNELKGFNPPRYVYKTFDMRVNECIVIENAFKIKSMSLKNHLKDCRKLAVMAVTLGVEADAEINKSNKLDITKAVIFNACADAYIENVCDRVAAEIKKSPVLCGLKSVFRFSPGYGDFDLKYQKDILDVLNALKNIGLTLNDSFMLIPTKSVTAVVGFSDNIKQDESFGCSKCAQCDMSDTCGFSKKEEVRM